MINCKINGKKIPNKRSHYLVYDTVQMASAVHGNNISGIRA